MTPMGQIVIETPNRLKRRYQINQESLSELVEFLDSSGVRLDFSQLTSEDLADIRAARNVRKEESITWEEAKTQLGL
jgi:predicted nucleic-acid-binding protein